MRRNDLFAAFPTAAALGILASLLTLLRGSAYGAGLRLDSPSYLSVAKNLLTGNGFTIWNGDVYYGCPLFPAVLAFTGLFGLDAVEAAGYVNAAAFGLTVLATVMWLHSRVRSRFLAVWAGCACVLSLDLAENAAFAITESLFILLAALSLFALDRFLESGKRSFLLAAASWAALACSTRQVGLSLIVAALPLLLLQRGTAFAARAKNAASYAAAAAAPFVVWTARSFLQEGLLVDKVTSTKFTLLGSLHVTSDVFVKWILRKEGFGRLSEWSEKLFGGGVLETPALAGVLLKTAILLALAAGAGYALKRLRRWGYLQDWRILAVPVSFAAVYSFLLAIVLPLYDVEMPPRYLAPLYAPLLVAAGLILNEFLLCAADGRKRRWRLRGMARSSLSALALKLCLALWLAPQIRANYDNMADWLDSARYGNRQWNNSETIRYMESRASPDIRLWNNAPEWLPTLMHARVELYRWLWPIGLPDEVKNWAAITDADGKEAWFVWFHEIRGHPYGIEDLLAIPGVEVEAALEDGIVLKGNMETAGGAPPSAADALLPAVLQGARPIVRAEFDVYLDDDGNRLIYLKEQCRSGDTDSPFFLHVVPVDLADLSHYRRGHAFDSRGFRFDDYGFTFDGQCAAVQNLPDYAAAEIKTGQWIPGEGSVWEAAYRFGEPAE